MKFIKKITRRGFIKKAIITLASLELLYVFVNLLNKGSEAKEATHLFNAGDTDLFEHGKLYPFSNERFYLSRLTDGGFLAISTKCTHLGCTVQFKNKDNKFICPCHASAFNKFGEVLAPPATRALDILPITIANNKVMIDLNKPQKRLKHNSSQITYA
ncbi:ubiquinol-cytochrome c reductase iron-sulfur subunit [Carboxylicivirga taeanensis]|uniref:QcrA and Rieske domain-containing protein n=1 Tax=Carboxylicivirga taeanensis TaxID=1416875 RepID=UPI003F6E34A8